MTQNGYTSIPKTYEATGMELWLFGFFLKSPLAIPTFKSNCTYTGVCHNLFGNATM